RHPGGTKPHALDPLQGHRRSRGELLQRQRRVHPHRLRVGAAYALPHRIGPADLLRYTTMYGQSRHPARWFALSVALLAACSVTDEILQVQNPAELPVKDLNSPQLVNVLVAGVIGDFTHMYDDPFIWRGSMFTDEQVTGINWEQTARLNQRIVQFDEGDADLMFV